MKQFLTATALLLLTTTAAIAGTIRVENSDSKEHTIVVDCSGSKKTIEIKASTTTSYTFHSSDKSCKIAGGSVSFPTGTLEDGQKWKIKDGAAKPN
ncbi:MAG: hypothetical protein SFX73_39780 [Kofleriaceae bacterium]|nr:hypothetical protein [Kofleriaceae bacterium]